MFDSLLEQVKYVCSTTSIHRISVLVASARCERSDETAHQCAVSPEPPLLAYTKYESRERLKLKLIFLACLNRSTWAFKGSFCAYVVKRSPVAQLVEY